MKSEDVNGSRDVLQAVRQLLDRRGQDEATIATLQARLEDVEDKQGFLARRPKIAVPRFPDILRRYGIIPPDDEGAEA